MTVADVRGRLRPREPDDRAATLPALLARSVAAGRDGTAIATDAETLSYAALDQRVRDMARALVATGAGKGTRIALLAPDGILWLTTFLAATRIGAIVAPISTLSTAAELGYLLRHSDAHLLIGVARFLRHDYVARLEAALPDIVGQRAGRLRLARAPFLRAIWLDDAVPDWAGSHADLRALATGEDALDDALIDAMAREVAPTDPAVMIYTSGSTAHPKAVLHAQRSVARHSQVMAEYFRVRPGDRMMPLLPLFWVGGLNMALQVLQAGATLVYPRTPETADVVATIARHGVTRINSWGPQLATLRAAAAARGIDVDAIGGFAAPRDAAGAVIPPDLYPNMLGMTETFGPHSAGPIDVALPPDQAGASGGATEHYERRIVDPETGRVLRAGETGELQVRGGALMLGLYKAEPEAVFTPDGFYPTGDLARIEPNGHLHFAGRRGDMYKTAGANVSRLEVEAALRTLPGVALPVVLGLPDREAGQIVVAAIVPEATATLTPQGVREALRAILSSYKVPRHVVIVAEDDIAWTPSNKVRMAELAALVEQRIGRTAGAAR